MDKFLLQLDLNLLKALHVLLQEKNVTRAADKMFITQSAMSKTLRRLREAFNDPILIKTQTGLVTTPVAEQLKAQLNLVFGQLEFLSPAQFDPATTQECIRIASPETFALGIVPDFILHLKQRAPGLQLELLHLHDDYITQLAEGEVDFVIYLDQPYPDEILSHRLFSSAPRVWCRQGHPLTSKAVWTLEDICTYPKIAFDAPNILPTELHHIMAVLESAELQREVLLKTSHLLVALTMLGQSDALMVAPDYLFSYPVSNVMSHSISHIPLFHGMREVNVDLIQHQRTENSPLHRWIVAQALDVLTPGTPRSLTPPQVRVVSSR